MGEQYILKTLSNAIDVLELFETSSSGLTPKEIEERMGMNRTNLFRILYTLRHRGLLEIDQTTGRYQLGMKVIHYASLSLQRLDIKKISHPYLLELRDVLNETIHLVVMNNDLAVFVDKVSINEEINMGSYIGWNAPLYCTASGKLLLSSKDNKCIEEYFKRIQPKKYTHNTLIEYERLLMNIKEIRAVGYSVDQEEMVEGLTCYSVPVKGHSGEIIAAISVSGATTRMQKNKDFILEELRRTASSISVSIIKIPQGVI